MKNLFIRISLLALAILGPMMARAQSNAPSSIDIVEKKIFEFENRFDLSNPLSSYVTCSYIYADGRQSMFRDIATYRNKHKMPPIDAPDKPVSYRDQILGRKIVEIRRYGDSAAVAIVEYDLPMHIIGSITYEDGKWVNYGEDLANSLEEARERADERHINLLSYLRRLEQLKQTPTDTAPLAKYLKENGQKPSDYMLAKLEQHKLVICGELHRRKISWDLMKEVISDPRFAATTGTVFVELPSWKQDVLDKFYASSTMNRELILDVMRAEQVYGWWDGGEYEFLQMIWQLNQQLPQDKKIKVVAADWQAPWDQMRTKEEFERYSKTSRDRNTHMADIIESTLNSSADQRHALFIVGCGHARKSHVPGTSSTPRGQEPAFTAGRQLTDRLSEQNVFITYPHTMIISNDGFNRGVLRGGAFDRAFAENGNSPVGFDLRNSPFGSEPFDGADETLFSLEAGTYEQNFDGYLFFGPLSEEGPEYHTYDVFSDDFVEEIKRRAVVAGWENESFFGLPVTKLSKEHIINRLKSIAIKSSRW